MHHFFVKASQVKGKKISIEGGDVNHILQVLRMRAGDKITVSDGENHTYLCELEEKQGESLSVLILEEEEKNRELPVKLYLFQGLPKQDKMDWIVQKAVELGVGEILPVSMHRSVVQFDEKKKRKKQERWQQIAESAAKQSGRGMVPRVSEVCTLGEALKIAKELDVVLLPYELAENVMESQTMLSALPKSKSIGIFIGPEGGFEQEEVAQIEAIGGKRISLGRRILRTETAAIGMLAILMFALEE